VTEIRFASFCWWQSSSDIEKRNLIRADTRPIPELLLPRRRAGHPAGFCLPTPRTLFLQFGVLQGTAASRACSSLHEHADGNTGGDNSLCGCITFFFFLFRRKMVTVGQLVARKSSYNKPHKFHTSHSDIQQCLGQYPLNFSVSVTDFLSKKLISTPNPQLRRKRLLDVSVGL
jgi:hypothetical protein